MLSPDQIVPSGLPNTDYTSFDGTQEVYAADTQAMHQHNRGSMVAFDHDTCIGETLFNPVFQSCNVHINNATAVVKESGNNGVEDRQKSQLQFDKYLDKKIIMEQRGCTPCKKLVFAVLILVRFKDLPSVLLTSCYLT